MALLLDEKKYPVNDNINSDDIFVISYVVELQALLHWLRFYFMYQAIIHTQATWLKTATSKRTPS